MNNVTPKPTNLWKNNISFIQKRRSCGRKIHVFLSYSNLYNNAFPKQIIWLSSLPTHRYELQFYISVWRKAWQRLTSWTYIFPFQIPPPKLKTWSRDLHSHPAWPGDEDEDDVGSILNNLLQIVIKKGKNLTLDSECLLLPSPTCQ